VTLLTNLNRRHKAILFVTLLAVGVCFTVGAGVQMGVGIALLGVAFGWAFGSNNRVVHVLFLCAGMLFVVVPVIRDWHSHRRQANLYQKHVAELEALPDGELNVEVVTPDGQNWTVPQKNLEKALERGATLVPQDETKFKYTAENPKTLVRLGWNGKKWIVISHLQKIDPPLNFSVRKSVAENWILEVAGSLLFGTGLGLVVRVKPNG
jgi:hypothetical protein